MGMYDAITARSWLFEEVLPRWSTAGVDHEAGGFHELLDYDGLPVAGVPKRMRVQARQIFSFCYARSHGWDGPALALAHHGFRFLTEHYWHEDGGFVFAVDDQGRPVDDRREVYEAAFALLAFAAYFKLSRNPEALSWIERTEAFLDGLGDGAAGGYLEAVPASLPRRQNPHMHLLEASLALFEATGAERHLDRALKLWSLFREHLFDAETGTLGEYFDADLRPCAGQLGQAVEPGHHFEWVWLLERLHQFTGEEVFAAQMALYDFAGRHGVSFQSGLALDEVSRCGAVRVATKRLWPQTEHLKALVSLGRFSGYPVYLQRADQVYRTMAAHYFDVGNGTWRDRLDETDKPVGTVAPASTLYHVIVSVLEHVDLAERLSGGIGQAAA